MHILILHNTYYEINANEIERNKKVYPEDSLLLIFDHHHYTSWSQYAPSADERLVP